jgi:hypothetical protein
LPRVGHGTLKSLLVGRRFTKPKPQLASRDPRLSQALKITFRVEHGGSRLTLCQGCRVGSGMQGMDFSELDADPCLHRGQARRCGNLSAFGQRGFGLFQLSGLNQHGREQPEQVGPLFACALRPERERRLVEPGGCGCGEGAQREGTIAAICSAGRARGVRSVVSWLAARASSSAAR